MDTLTLAEAKAKRTQIKSAATRLKNFVEGFNTSQGSRHDIIERKKKLADLWPQFDAVQSRIENLENVDPAIADKEALSEQQSQQRACFENPYFNLMSRYEILIEHYNQSAATTSTRSESSNTVNTKEMRIKLPKIDLPVFSGAYEDWYSYQDTFEKLIHLNVGLTEIEKFHYLRSSLKEKATEIIKSIETTTDNYFDAWCAVKERFDNKRLIIQKHIRAIFEVTALNKENHVALRELLDTILKHLRALKALKRPTESWDDLIVHIIISKLDMVTAKAWETSTHSASIPDLKMLTDFLSKRCQALESIQSKSQVNLTNNTAQKQVSKHKGAAVTNIATTNLSCPLCKENHHLYHCDKFLKLSVEERSNVAKKSHRYTNCLRSSSHKAQACNSGACRKCNGKHNTLLHMSSVNNSNQSVADSKISANPANNPVPVSTQCVSLHNSFNALLSTAIIHIYDANQQLHSCRVLLDSGSQINFITQELVNRLQLNERSLQISVAGIKQEMFRTDTIVNVCIKSRFNNFNAKLECVVVPHITQQLPQRFITIQDVSVPKNIKLADPNFNIPSNIDILIGADLFWNIICAGQIRQSKTQPILQKTHFGWVISGPITNAEAGSLSSVNCHVSVVDDLSHELSKFWEIEHITSPQPFTKEEQACENLFLQDVRRNQEGRFIVKLPVRQEKLSKLGESHEIALRRFKALERRLITQPKMYAEYRKFMKEYEDLNHMQVVGNLLEPAAINPSFYLPHHAVRNETSTTTKFRVVFDGSCKTSTDISLNDTLMIGPTLQEDLFSILTRFRTFNVALTADIKKMYRQVLVDPTQTALQRIFWRNSVEEPIKTYELLTVTYGTSAASFLAIRALRKLAEDQSDKYPVVSQIALRDFYVDDLTTGANTEQEAMHIKNEITQLLQQGKFELCKWASNASSLQDEQSTSGQREFVLSTDKQSERRTLGLTWQCQADNFIFSSIAQAPPLQTPTKRSILSRIAWIFDPLGLLGPVTVVAKLIMQELWRLKLDWDESIPLALNTKWQRYEKELQDLRNINVPRHAIGHIQHTRLELHGFSDASESAYGACIYLRSTSQKGEHVTRLLCSKSRVAPIKSLSLPRLELSGAQLLAQLVDKVVKCLPCKIDSIHLWTDSTIVLSWLQSSSRSWSTFVAHRIGEIQQLTPVQSWNHVKSEHNPADALSRGVMPRDLAKLQTWWNGPSWLNCDKEEWPQGYLTIPIENLPEKRSKGTAAVATRIQESTIFERYSRFTKLIRIVSYIFRFANNARQHKNPTSNGQTSSVTKSIQPLTAEEQDEAIKRLSRVIQASYFSEELKSLEKHGVVNKNSSILKLNPFIDNSGILRVGGRLETSSLPYAAKHPILLPGHHPFSHLIIRHEHERHFHAGPQATLFAIRERYWLISARDVVRHIIHKCVICFRSAPKPASAVMGNLPPSRVNIPAKVFDKCGLDYAGPLYYKEGTRKNTKLIKCYIAIFVCLATKAVHIELASSLSTESFLNVFKRFIARRGCPSDIFSDNGSNFVGAKGELKELENMLQSEEAQQQIINHLANQSIRWHFIPSRAPHHGGIWEAAVKAAKRQLIKMTGNANLRREELETLLVQIEAILNSRPITPISCDPNDLVH